MPKIDRFRPAPSSATEQDESTGVNQIINDGLRLNFIDAQKALELRNVAALDPDRARKQTLNAIREAIAEWQKNRELQKLI